MIGNNWITEGVLNQLYVEDREMWSRRGQKNAERFSWLNCALHWKELFEKDLF